MQISKVALQVLSVPLPSHSVDSGCRIALQCEIRRLQPIHIDQVQQRGEPLYDARRNVYRLTDIGIDLAPLLLETVLWSARHFETTAPAEVIEEMTHRRARFLAGVRTAWKKKK